MFERGRTGRTRVLLLLLFLLVSLHISLFPFISYNYQSLGDTPLVVVVLNRSLVSFLAVAAVAAGTPAAAASGAGFSKLELAAALSGGITPGNAPTAVSSL